MATLQSFNVFLTERLTAAALDIYGFVEKAVRDYQEEVTRTRLENQRLQRLLDMVYKPEIRLHRADAKQPTPPSSAEKIHPERQEWSKSVCQDMPRRSLKKEDQEEQREKLWINGLEEQPSAEDSNDGDALTKELIQTVQQLEDYAAAEESREPKETTKEEHSEEKTGPTAHETSLTFHAPDQTRDVSPNHLGLVF
ncbi:hypothetical protein INR49_031899 [Caranx melampygus]|nr:hypothetical protein INR49_031899 [Caranx melampygus]